MANTKIAETENFILAEFAGTSTSSPAYLIINKNPKVISIISGIENTEPEIQLTYSMKKTGLITEGMELGLRVRKAVNQRYDNSIPCDYSEIKADSISDVYKQIIGTWIDGGIQHFAIN